MDKETIKMTVDSRDLRGLYQAFKSLDKDTNAALKVEVQGLTDYVARQIKMAAADAPNPRQASLVATTVRANKDRVPNITIGGSRKFKASRRGTERNPLPSVGQVLFGSEFGATGSGAGSFKQGGRKFPYWSGRYGHGSRGWWIFPTLRQLQPKITHDYHAIIDRYIKKDW